MSQQSDRRIAEFLKLVKEADESFLAAQKIFHQMKAEADPATLSERLAREGLAGLNVDGFLAADTSGKRLEILLPFMMGNS